jgi:hypothetical protein
MRPSPPLPLLAALLGAAAAAAAAAAPAVAERPAVVLRVLREAAPPGARLELLAYRGPLRCQPQEVDVEGPVVASGPVPLRVAGLSGSARCAGAAQAEVRLFAPAWVTSRALSAGEPVAGAAVREERELRPGHQLLAEPAAGLLATRALPAGTLLEARLVEDPAWAMGATVRVLVRSGSVLLAQQGRLVPCAPGRACAQLPSGRRVEGRRQGTDLLLELP